MPDIHLSIIVITYNQEDTISQTLDSILEQEHSYTYELIIADDCSSDNTRNIINDYKKKFPTIIKAVFNDRNLGVVGNYFNAIRQSVGEIIMQCAGDDYWLPGKIETQIEAMTDQPDVGICYAKAHLFYQDSQVLSRATVGLQFEGYFQLFKNNPIPALTVAVQRSLVWAYMEDMLQIARGWPLEDYPIWLWLANRTRFHFIDKPLAVYRVCSDSVSNSKSYEKMLRYVDALVEIRKYFFKNVSNERGAVKFVYNSYNNLLSYGIRARNRAATIKACQELGRFDIRFRILRTILAFKPAFMMICQVTSARMQKSREVA